MRCSFVLTCTVNVQCLMAFDTCLLLVNGTFLKRLIIIDNWNLINVLALFETQEKQLMRYMQRKCIPLSKPLDCLIIVKEFFNWACSRRIHLVIVYINWWVWITLRIISVVSSNFIFDLWLYICYIYYLKEPSFNNGIKSYLFIFVQI